MAGIQFNLSPFNPFRSYDDITETSYIYILLFFISFFNDFRTSISYTFPRWAHDRKEKLGKIHSWSPLRFMLDLADRLDSKDQKDRPNRYFWKLGKSRVYRARPRISFTEKGRNWGLKSAKILSRRFASDLCREVVDFKGPRPGRLLTKQPWNRAHASPGFRGGPGRRSGAPASWRCRYAWESPRVRVKEEIYS